MGKLYREYFNIDPKYYAAVTADLIEQGKVSWKGFLPHETFVKLLEVTYKALSGQDPRSIWVEGAYGTGKSHAALTVKSILDATDEEVIEYFDDFGLRQDLRDQYIALKNNGKILTIHRVGSAGIDTDLDLILAVQQSIMAALKANGIENHGDASMKDAFLHWMESPVNHDYFEALIRQEKYAWTFGSATAQDVVEQLNNGSTKLVEATMRNVMTVLKDAGQYGLFSDVNDMANWIKSVIEENKLSAILFVWDEFSEYFISHPVSLTGFQTLAEISASHPFYFMLVTHESRNLFADAATAKKTFNRFVGDSTVRIDLPENIAFDLMYKAMKTTNDPVLAPQWERDKNDLNDELVSVRNLIVSTAKRQTSLSHKTAISDNQLCNIVPMHPYAALILMQIAVLFTSNQRSMFDFIISNDMTDAKGFKWYINNYGPDDEQNLLTVDLLWDFFYGKGQNGLDDAVRGILDNYRMLNADRFLPDEQRVLKVILLLQAVAFRKGDNELLRPNEQNLDLAFAGTDWSKGKALAIAKGLIEKGVIFQKPVGGGKTEYSVANGAASDVNMAELIQKISAETKTQALITNSDAPLIDKLGFCLPPAFEKRYIVEATSYASFTATVQKMKALQRPERFKLIITFSINDTEQQQLHQQIVKAVNMPSNDIVFVECMTPLGKDLLQQYANNMAFSKYHTGKDNTQAKHFANQAGNVLSEWRRNIVSGAFILYDNEHKAGQHRTQLTDLQEALREKNQRKYYYGLEHYSLNATMYNLYQPANGAGFGITQTLSGAYSNNNKKMSFETALDGAWKVERYWEDPAKQGLTIVHIKKRVMELVEQGFDNGSGRVSILNILHEMEKEPFGFMPSSVTAFVMGFVLKEYATPDFFWSNGSRSEQMTVDKMKTMIGNAVNELSNHDSKYKEELIVTMSPDVRSFLNCAVTAFDLSRSVCGSVESTRDQLRIKMKSFAFPIWCIKYTLGHEQLETPRNILEQLIDQFSVIVNTANGGHDTESDIAASIGKLVRENPTAEGNLARLMTGDQCRKGMLEYLKIYRDGLLVRLSTEIGDGGAYIDEVKKRFNASDANWVWAKVSADEKISDVILDYQIVQESNKSLPKCISIRETTSAWNARTNNIHIPCGAVAKLTGDLGPFLQQLAIMKQNNALLDQHKQTFYDLLMTQRESFEQFYKSQVNYFKQDANAFLSGLDDAEIAELYESFPQGQFTKGKSDYYKFVQAEVEKFVLRQWKKKLRDLWQEKTGTKDPKDWSTHYSMPILCMFDDAERAAVKPIFQIVISANPNEADAKKAMDFLTSATFYDRLQSPEERERCFMQRIVGTYQVLLNDPDQIRHHLSGTLYEDAYDWMNNSSVQREIKKLAEKEYLLTGSDRAMAIIDQMSTEQLRSYLRGRIQDDTEFGIQILKNQ